MSSFTPTLRSTSPISQHAGQSTGPTILLVDDEESVRVTLQAILEGEGYRVTAAGSAAEALRRLGDAEVAPYDLVLADLRLADPADGDGMAVVAAARRRDPDAIAVVLTGYATMDAAIHALRAGAHDFLTKPSDLDELKATVARGIERRRLTLQARRAEALEREIGGRRATETALRESRDQLATILRAIADGVTVQDHNGRLIYANDAAARTMGFASGEELTATPVAEILARYEILGEDGGPLPLDRFPGRRALVGETEPEQLFRFRIRGPGTEGAVERWSLVRATAVLDDAGRVRFAVNVIREVTEQRQEARREAALAEASRVFVASGLQLEDVLDAVVRQVAEAVGDGVSLSLVSDDGEWVDIAALYHADPEQRAFRLGLTREVRLRRGAGIVGQVVESGEPFVTDDVRHAQRVAASSARFGRVQARYPFSAIAGVPLRAAGRVTGALVATRDAPSQPYAAADVALLQELADRAALAVQNARLHEDERRARERLEAAHRQQAVAADLGLLALRGAGLQELMDEAAARTAVTLGVDFARVLELQPDGRALRLRAGVGWSAGLIGTATVPAGLESQSGYTLLGDAPLIVEDLRSETRFAVPAMLRDHSVVSGVGAVIHGRERRYGVFDVHTRALRRFSVEEVHFLQAVANVLAAAIEQQRAEQERRAALDDARAARARAEEAVRQRDTFISIASHELRTPLTSMHGYAQIARRALQHPDERRAERVGRAVEMLDEQTRRIVRLVSGLFDVTSIQTGKLTLERSDADVGELIRRAVAEARLKTDAHEIVVRGLDGAGQMRANVDHMRLEQVLVNLLDNAIKYSPDGGGIEVAVALRAVQTHLGESGVERPHGGGALQLTVRDHGLGIPAERLPDVFQPYYQAHADTAVSRAGLGLGLYVCKQIVELHGGAIEVSCPADGGTCVAVTIPVRGA